MATERVVDVPQDERAGTGEVEDELQVCGGMS